MRVPLSLALLVACSDPSVIDEPPDAAGDAMATGDAMVDASEPPLDAATISSRYLLSFARCPEAGDCGSPTTHETYLAEGDDGQSWSVVPGWTPYSGGPGSSGSVPDVIRRGDTIYLYNPLSVRRYDVTTGELTDPFPVTIDGETSGGFVDPSLMVIDGALVLFYLPGIIGQPPGMCAEGEDSCMISIRSAVEVPGSDGEEFTLVDGDRATRTISAGASFTDPDIFADDSGYVLLVSQGSNVIAYRSNELHGTYLPVSGLTDGFLVNGEGGIPAGYYNADQNEYWVYVHQGSGDSSIIRRAVVSSIDSAISGSSFGTVDVGSTDDAQSPGFALNEP